MSNEVFTNEWIPRVQQIVDEQGYIEISRHEIDNFFPKDDGPDPAVVIALAMGGNRQPSEPPSQEEKIRDFCKQYDYRYTIDLATGNLQILTRRS